MSEPGTIPVANRGQDSARVFQTAKTQVATLRPALNDHLNTDDSAENKDDGSGGSPQKKNNALPQRYGEPNRVQHHPDENQGGIVDVTV
jgi:hypothetical protein